MRTPLALAVFALALAGCGGEDRQWMKINQQYTTEEFRRDYKACSPKSTLDEGCMRNRGWVEVSRSKTDKDVELRSPEPQRSLSRPGATGGAAR
jgi:hypothetical protein